MVASGSTAELTRVWTVTEVDVVPASRTAEVGGVTTSSLVAVPPGVRLTVMSLLEDWEAVITNVAGLPWTTVSFTDWIVSVGPGIIGRTTAVRVPSPACPPVDTDVVAAPAGGPMTRPAEAWKPSLYPVPCSSDTVTDSGVAGVELG